MEYLNNYLKYIQYEKGVSKHTFTAYYNDLHQFVNFITNDAGCFVLKNLDNSDVRRWILFMMSEKVNPNSISRKVSSLNSFFKYCLRHNIIETNPALHVALPKKAKRLPSFLQKNEVEKLFSQEKAADNFKDIRDDLILEMLVGLGIRRAELVSLCDNSIDYSNRVVKVIGKRNKERITPAYAILLDKCRNYIKLRQEEYPQHKGEFFLTDRGKPIYDKFVYLLVKRRISEISTIDKRSPHVMRHTYATLLLNEGADIEILRELLGHSSLASTQVYTHSTFEELRKMYSAAHPRMKDPKQITKTE